MVIQAATANAQGRMIDGKVGYLTAKDRNDQADHPTNWLRLIPSEVLL